jgi:hypothetical protein
VIFADESGPSKPSNVNDFTRKVILGILISFPFNQIKPTTSDDLRNFDKNGIENENMKKTRKERVQRYSLAIRGSFQSLS